MAVPPDPQRAFVRDVQRRRLSGQSVRYMARALTKAWAIVVTEDEVLAALKDTV